MTTTKLQIYDGMGDPEDFVQQFKICAVMQEWDEQKQLENLQLFLKGKAKRDYDSIANKNAIKDVLAALVKKCTKPEDHLLMQFYGRRQLPNESIASYANALRELLEKAIPGLDETHQTTLLRSQLCLAIPEHMRALIQFNSNTSWDQVIGCLDKSFPHIQHATTLSQVGGHTPQPLIKTEAIDSNWAESKRTSNVEHQPRQQNDRHDDRRRPNDLKCYNCNRFGHFSSECQEPRRPRNNQQVRNSYRNYSGSRGRGNNTSTNTGRAQAHTTNATKQEELEEFPFFCENNTTLAVMMSMTNGEGAQLLRAPVELELFDQRSQVVFALIDGGSTHSFISPDVLTPAQKQVVSDPNTIWCRRQRFEIQGVVKGTEKSLCCVTNAQIRLGDWSGEHEFVISGSVRNHDMILGRDFFKRHDVTVMHKDDTVKIGDMVIKVNTLTRSNELDNETSDEESNEKAEIRELRKQVAMLTKLVEQTSQAKEISADEHKNVKVNLNCIKFKPVQAKIAIETRIRPNSEQLVQINCQNESLKTNTIMFEPKYEDESRANILMARSLHLNCSDELYCNVVNASEKEIVLEQGKVVGHMTEAEIAQEQFDNEVMRYEPLNEADIKKAMNEIATQSKSNIKFSQIESIKVNKSISAMQRKQLQAVLWKNASVFQ